MSRHRIQLPATDYHNLSQNEAYFNLVHNNGDVEKIFFHDYGRIYQTPGLYEQIFYDRLRCQSPKIVTEILHQALTNQYLNFSELRVLDFGAGNGLMGQALKKYGVSRLVGADIEPSAREATNRDRPGIYDDYFVTDFTQLGENATEELLDWGFNCLTTVAALGFGDIPVKAFFTALNSVSETGWIAFNIKESFLSPSDQTGFSSFIRQLILSEHFHVHFIQRYQHRLSIEGKPLYYYAIVARKRSHVPEEMILAHT